MRNSIILILLSVFAFDVKSQSSKYYKPGHYYNLKGEKRSGLIFIDPSLNVIGIKNDEKSKKRRVNIDSISSVVANNDSLVVLTHKNKSDYKFFGRLVATSPVRKFYCIYKRTVSGGTGISHSVGSPGSGFVPHHPNHYSGSIPLYVYQEGNTTYPLERGNYIEILTQAFTDFPILVRKIRNKEIKYKDLNKMFDQYKSHTLQKPVE